MGVSSALTDLPPPKWPQDQKFPDPFSHETAMDVRELAAYARISRRYGDRAKVTAEVLLIAGAALMGSALARLSEDWSDYGAKSASLQQQQVLWEQQHPVDTRTIGDSFKASLYFLEILFVPAAELWVLFLTIVVIGIGVAHRYDRAARMLLFSEGYNLARDARMRKEQVDTNPPTANRPVKKGRLRATFKWAYERIRRIFTN